RSSNRIRLCCRREPAPWRLLVQRSNDRDRPERLHGSALPQRARRGRARCPEAAVSARRCSPVHRHPEDYRRSRRPIDHKVFLLSTSRLLSFPPALRSTTLPSTCAEGCREYDLPALWEQGKPALLLE